MNFNPQHLSAVSNNVSAPRQKRDSQITMDYCYCILSPVVSIDSHNIPPGNSNVAHPHPEHHIIHASPPGNSHGFFAPISSGFQSWSLSKYQSMYHPDDYHETNHCHSNHCINKINNGSSSGGAENHETIISKTEILPTHRRPIRSCHNNHNDHHDDEETENWFMHLVHLPERIRQNKNARDRFNVNIATIEMREQLKNLHVY